MIVCVIGLIGSGKSTLVNNLALRDNYTIFEEPVDNNPFLVDYYKDPARWSFTLQTYYLWERYKQTQEAYMRSLRGEIVILDSSIYSDAAFAILQYDSHYFTNDEYKTYLNMHSILASKTAYPDIVIKLELSVEESLNRINKRSRDCENNIPIQYLKDLNEAYHTILNKLSKHTNIIYVDANKSADDVYNEVSGIINNYKEKMSDFNINYL